MRSSYLNEKHGKGVRHNYHHTVLVGVDNCIRHGQVQEDLENNVAGAVPIPSDGEKEEVIAALVANVEAMIKADRKITSLKQLQVRPNTNFFFCFSEEECCYLSLLTQCLTVFQGHIWRTGFQRKEIEAVVYDDVPEALEKWNALGIKVILLAYEVLIALGNL